MGLCGGIGGFLIRKMQENISSERIDFPTFMFAILLVLITVILAFFVHLYIHETGHLIFGLLSGYRFQSIRFGSLMIVKSDKGIKLHKFSLAGTGGQCLMLPPATDPYPTSLYNWGGCIMNILISLVCFTIFLLTDKTSLFSLVMIMLFLVGLSFAILNGIPFAFLSNDGYNASILKKDINAKKAFKIQLLISNSLAQGNRIKDMPTEWFDWAQEVPKNNLTASAGVMRFNYLIEMKKFEEAKKLGNFLLDKSLTLANIHELLIKSELLFCDILLDCDTLQIKANYEKDKKKLASLATLPSMQRFFYAYYLLVQKDTAKAEQSLKQFNTLAKRYPYPSEIESERELIALVEKKNSVVESLGNAVD